MKKTTYALILVAIMYSCKKQEPVVTKKCMLDSINVITNSNFINIYRPIYTYKFKYTTSNEIEIYVTYRTAYGSPGLSGLAYKIYFNSKNYPSVKEFYDFNSPAPTGKNEFFYNDNNELVKIKSSIFRNNAYVKFSEINLSYTDKTLSQLEKFGWNLNDTINPATIDKYSFYGRNGNVEYDVPPPQSSNYYRILQSENILTKNFYYLLDPVFQLHIFDANLFSWLPFITNKNTTISIFYQPYYQTSNNFRMAVNKNGNPESILNSKGIADYFYKDCD